MITEADRMSCFVAIIGYIASLALAVLIGKWLFQAIDVNTFLEGILWFVLWSITSGITGAIIMISLSYLDSKL